MRVVFQTNDGQIFPGFDEAHQHEGNIFDRWAAQPIAPEDLITMASDCVEGYFSGPADEVLSQIFMEMCH